MQMEAISLYLNGEKKTIREKKILAKCHMVDSNIGDHLLCFNAKSV